MLNRTPESLQDRRRAGTARRRRAGAPPKAGARRIADLLRQSWHLFVRISFSSLTRRIVFLNVAGLLALVIGILYLSQFRAGLIDARIQSLLVQGEIIAGAIAASATVETDTITIDPERLLELQAGESYGPPTRRCPGSSSRSIRSASRRCCAGWCRRPTRARASTTATASSSSTAATSTTCCASTCRRRRRSPACSSAPMIAIRTWLSRGTLPLYRELGPQNGKGYGEVAQALQGFKSSMVRINERGEVIVSVAVPVQRFRAVRGALLLSTQGGDIDQMVEAERLADLQGVPDRRRRHGGAVVPARGHHRRPGAAARRKRRAGAPAHPLARRDSRPHPPARRDRAPVRRRCAT